MAQPADSSSNGNGNTPTRTYKRRPRYNCIHRTNGRLCAVCELLQDVDRFPLPSQHSSLLPPAAAAASTPAAAAASVAVPMSGRVCGTCSLAGGDKYKCAQCKQFKYCSVACYRKHQAETCTAVTQPAGSQPPPASAASGSASAAASSNAAAASPAAAAAASTPVVPAVPKSSLDRVSPADLDRLAATPAILSALQSAELQAILRRIDSGGGGGGGAADDERRMAELEKYRATNPDFEAFIRQVIGIIDAE